ncbi:cysteine peptidase family C39 domain-containing protein [Arhodomonas sp. SL1]|uniref:cysteine peptidase family C39 domain-containing protein n=1 Tax=Arhodomonas sp. SL1 TaxID=3425691 RepID=UPI003F882617
MSELIATDTNGNAHFIWLQRREDSCGPACVYMIERIVRQHCPIGGEARVRQIAALLPNGYNEGDGTASYKALASTLDLVGLPASTGLQKDMGEFLRGGEFPLITRVGWPNGGGHFVVCVAFGRNGTVVCLDPWYGLEEPKLDRMPT